MVTDVLDKVFTLTDEEKKQVSISINDFSYLICNILYRVPKDIYKKTFRIYYIIDQNISSNLGINNLNNIYKLIGDNVLYIRYVY